MRIDSNGALGLGTTPPTTNAHPQLFIGSESFILGSTSGALDIGNNLYYNSGWKHRTTAAGSLLDFDASGNFKFYTAASAAADSAATLSERMRINSSGNIGIGQYLILIQDYLLKVQIIQVLIMLLLLIMKIQMLFLLVEMMVKLLCQQET